MQLENGTYPAHPTGRVEVGDHSNGCLIAVMEFALDDGGQRISNTFWLTTKDGAINTKAITTLKEIFGWDGADPFWLVDHGEEFTEIPVELVIENETFTGHDQQDHTVPKIKWVNQVGRMGGVEIANGDRKALMAKYGAKLRAVSGGSPAPAKKATTPPSAPPKSAPSASSKKKVPPSDMDTCWGALTEAMADKPRGGVEAQWFEVLKDCHGDKVHTEYDGTDWGVVLAKLRTLFDNLPY